MEKNVIVSDANGRRIGATYPKRARGLVKNGRAELISDHEIRLLLTQPPASFIDTEDSSMSKVIQFNTREFDFDESCQSNTGFRGFVTTALGNEEVWEIGDWGWNWTQLAAEIKNLEPNTDYVFRFAMTLGHNDDGREESLVHLHYSDGDAKQAWKDRFTYCIKMSRFKPILSKRDPDEDTMIRVFELPFNTGEHTSVRILIISQHAIARFSRARANEDYASLEDLSYEQWRARRTQTLAADALAREKAKADGNNSGVSMEDSIREMFENAMEDSRAEMADMLEDRIDEAINDSISEFFSEGMENFLATHSLALNDGTSITTRQRTKVLSPDKKKLLTCYGGLKVEDTTRWNGQIPKGWALAVQTRISSWESIYVYKTEKEATDALVAVNNAIKEGMSLIEL